MSHGDAIGDKRRICLPAVAACALSCACAASAPPRSCCITRMSSAIVSHASFLSSAKSKYSRREATSLLTCGMKSPALTKAGRIGGNGFGVAVRKRCSAVIIWWSPQVAAARWCPVLYSNSSVATELLFLNNQGNGGVLALSPDPSTGQVFYGVKLPGLSCVGNPERREQSSCDGARSPVYIS